MKNKVFYLILLLGTGITLSVNAAIIQSDLHLLSDAPRMDVDEHADPHWDLAWHAKLAEYGDPDSQFFIAQVYEQGRLLPRDREKALSFYKKAAEQNHVESCMRLGKIYRDEVWGRVNLEESQNWYLRAAEQNYVPAQILLSELYEEKQEYDKAIIFLEKAMRHLFPDAIDLKTVSPDLERLYQLQEAEK